MVVLRPLKAIASSWNVYFHSPVSEETIRLTGYLRIFLAAIFLFDQALWEVDRSWLLSPSRGVVPPNYMYAPNVMSAGQHSLFELAPESDLLFWSVHYGGIVCGIFLLMGIAPRLSLLGVFVTMLSFQHSYPVAVDMQDDMLRIWSFWFFFLPLHEVTIYDFVRWWRQQELPRQSQKDAKAEEERSSLLHPSDCGKADNGHEHHGWTMWPYRLIQFQLFFIYIGAAFGKSLSSDSWTSGLELWRSMHAHIFCKSGMWQPDILLNTLLPLKCLAWLALFLEHVSLVTIWPQSTRNITVWSMVLFHLGIEVTMNMHTFEYVSILGWLFFLAKPDEDDASVDGVEDTNITTDAFGEDSQPDIDANDSIRSSCSIASGGDERDVHLGKKGVEGNKCNKATSASRRESNRGKANVSSAVPSSSTSLPATATAAKKLPGWELWERRILINPLIVILFLVTWAQCNPADRWKYFERLWVLRPVVESYNNLSYRVKSYSKPWVYTLGIWQEPWLIFSGGGSNPGYRWYARIEYACMDSDDDNDEDGTSSRINTMTWASFDWSSMPWWQQKRYQRVMLLYESLYWYSTSSSGLMILEGFTRKLYETYTADASSHGNGGRTGIASSSTIPGSIIKGFQNYQDQMAAAAEEGKIVKIISVLLRLEMSTGPWLPPDDLGPWDVPAVVPHPELNENYDVYYYITKPNKITDNQVCRFRLFRGECWYENPNTRFMWEACAKTCSEAGFFNQAVLVQPGTRVYVEDDEVGNRTYYAVLERLANGTFLYEEEETGEHDVGDFYRLDYYIAENDDKDVYQSEPDKSLERESVAVGMEEDKPDTKAKNEEQSLAPKECRVPFAYIISMECRQRATPIFDTETFSLLMMQ